MAKLTGGRVGFREWVDKQPDPGWTLMPLTHICKGVRAEDILRDGRIGINDDGVFAEPLAYFFYGRPAYRVAGDGAVKVEAACPYCFIFNGDLIRRAKAIHAFDTGAFDKRMYKHIVMEEMQVEDFSLETDVNRPNKIIAKVFATKASYFDGDISKVAKYDEVAEPWEFHARTYLQLLSSAGRNEPDDRICSIEVVMGDPIQLDNSLRAVVVPHTLWDDQSRAPWLEAIAAKGVEVLPYLFVPGRHPEHYHAMLEAKVREAYQRWDAL